MVHTPGMAGAEPRKVSLTTAVALVVANMIGTGVFVSLGYQLLDLRNGLAILLLWVIGGVVAICGALSYGELVARLPRSGGEYHFLTRIFHPALGLMAGVVSLTAGFAAPVAISAMAFGEYFANALEIGNPRLVALLVVVGMGGIHLGGTQVGAPFQIFFTALKVLLIAILIGAAFLIGEGGDTSFSFGPQVFGEVFSGPFAIGLIWVMYAYSGWNAAVYIAGEVRNPEQTLPRALVLGTLVVMGVYVLLNLAFLISAPAEALAGKADVGLVAGRWLFGEIGGRILGGLIAVGLISGISAMIWAGPRVAMVMGEDYRILSFLGRRDCRGTPVVGTLLQLALVAVLILTSSFDTVLLYTQTTLFICSGLSVLGVFVLRARSGRTVQGFLDFGYPWAPAIFLIMTLTMLAHSFWSHPLEGLAVVATLALGLGLYLFERAIGVPRT